MAAPWLTTAATAEPPLLAARSAILVMAASYRSKNSWPSGPAGIRRSRSPAAHANTVPMYRMCDSWSVSFSSAPASISCSPSSTSTSSPWSRASGAAVIWVRSSVEAYSGRYRFIGQGPGHGLGLPFSQLGQPGPRVGGVQLAEYVAGGLSVADEQQLHDSSFAPRGRS